MVEQLALGHEAHESFRRLRGHLGRTLAVTEADETTPMPALPEPLPTVPPLPTVVVGDFRDDELSSTVDGPSSGH